MSIGTAVAAVLIAFIIIIVIGVIIIAAAGLYVLSVGFEKTKVIVIRTGNTFYLLVISIR